MLLEMIKACIIARIGILDYVLVITSVINMCPHLQCLIKLTFTRMLHFTWLKCASCAQVLGGLCTLMCVAPFRVVL